MSDECNIFGNRTDSKFDTGLLNSMMSRKLSNLTFDTSKITTGILDKDRIPPTLNLTSISGLNDPVNSDNATNKKYVDSEISSLANKLDNKTWSGESIISGTIYKDRLPTTLNNFSVSRITGLNNPTNNTDAVNKSYVESEVLNQKIEIQRLLNRVSELERAAHQANSNESHFRLYIDNHKWSAESITSGTINIDRLPAKQYGCILIIGKSDLNTKTTIYNIPIPTTPNLGYRRINLQITLLLETNWFFDDLFCSIRNFSVINNSTINIMVDTHRGNKDLHWDLFLKAHLLITIFETEMTEIFHI